MESNVLERGRHWYMNLATRHHGIKTVTHQLQPHRLAPPILQSRSPGCLSSEVRQATSLGHTCVTLYLQLADLIFPDNKQLRQHRFARPTMRWPWSGDEDDEKKSSLSAQAAKLQSQDWATTLTDPATIGTSVALTASVVALSRFYKSYLRRIPSVNHIKPDYFRRRSLFGQVTSVGDADNFRLFHTPGGRIAGWGWLPWKKVPTTRAELANNTVCLSTV